MKNTLNTEVYCSFFKNKRALSAQYAQVSKVVQANKNSVSISIY